MKKLLLFIAFAALSVGAQAQVCDVTYTADTETMSGHDVSDGVANFKAVPMSEVKFQNERNVKVLDALSKEQDKCKGDDCYRIEVGEYRSCDGGPKVKQPAGQGSALLEGVTYAGMLRVGRVGLHEGDVFLKHHEAKSAKGEKVPYDHKKAKKVKRDELGKKQKDKD